MLHLQIKNDERMMERVYMHGWRQTIVFHNAESGMSEALPVVEDVFKRTTKTCQTCLPKMTVECLNIPWPTISLPHHLQSFEITIVCLCLRERMLPKIINRLHLQA